MSHVTKVAAQAESLRFHPLSEAELLGPAGIESGLTGRGEASLLTVGVFLPTVEFLCLQSVGVLVRRTFPL